MVALTIHPPFAIDKADDWDGAIWVGQLDVLDPELAVCDEITLVGVTAHKRARILVRDGLQPLGFFELEIENGRLDPDDVRRAVDSLPSAQVEAVDPLLPPMTVTVSTRNRPEELRDAISSLLKLDYPDFELLIVDNASSSDVSSDYVNSLDDPRVRLVKEPRPGLSRGRNRALIEAQHDWVAFTDDDVVVDPGWLRGLAKGLSQAPDTGVVCGMVATGEIASPAQMYFEGRIAWVGDTGAQIFNIDSPPADMPLFPFEVGAFGTGANFAVDRRLATSLGGFNEALGAGTPPGGGEDIDMFVRVLFAGRSLVRQPDALVWHRHRRDAASLKKQMTSYGTGMGAWIASVLAARQTRGAAIGSVGRVLARLPALGSVEASTPAPSAETGTAGLRRREIVGMVVGPAFYWRSRLGGRARRPLARLDAQPR